MTKLTKVRKTKNLKNLKNLMKETPVKAKQVSIVEGDSLLTNSKNMSVGKIGDANVTFAKKFRWTMEGQNLPSTFFKSVNIDHKNKTISFEYYEVSNGDQGFHGLVWADDLEKRNLIDETLLFKTYDGCGNVLYETEFAILKLLSNNTDFNYDNSQESIRHITVGYSFAISKLVSCQRALADTSWKMDILVNYNNKIENIDVTIDERPSINIEESEISHLNGSLFVPGKAKTKPIKLRFKKTDDAEFVNNIISGKPNFFEVHLRQYRGDNLLEIWELTDGWFKSIKFTGQEMETEMVYKSIRYKYNKEV